MREISYKYETITNGNGMNYNIFKTLCYYNGDIKQLHVGNSVCASCRNYIYRDSNKNTVYCVGDEEYELKKFYKFLLIEKKYY